MTRPIFLWDYESASNSGSTKIEVVAIIDKYIDDDGLLNFIGNHEVFSNPDMLVR